MSRRSIAIVGAGLAGGWAAETLRTKGYDGDIHLLGSEKHLPYERPPLSKQILLGTMPLEGPSLHAEDRWKALDINVVLGTTVERVVAHERALHLSSGDVCHADQVLLCTGSRASRLTVPGAEKHGVIHFRTLDDAKELRDRLAPGASVVIAGGGLIGGEVASAALAAGCRPTVIEMGDLPFLRALGPVWARTMMALHQRHQVGIRVRTRIIEVQGHGEVDSVILDDGARLVADVLVVGIGVRPADELAREVGALVDNGVVVDEFGRTSIDGIFAAGEVTNHPSPLFARRLRVESWDHAQRHAASVANNMVEPCAPYDEVPWFWTDQHGMNLQVAGLPLLAEDNVVRGDPESGSFCEFGLRDGVLVSATSANQGRELRRALPLIRQRARPSPESLSDASVDLRTLT